MAGLLQSRAAARCLTDYAMDTAAILRALSRWHETVEVVGIDSAVHAHARATQSGPTP